MQKHIIFILSLLLIAFPTYSIDLQSARDQGQVGETREGYIQAIKPSGKEVEKLISEVNTKRKKHYIEMAKKNKQPIEVVQKLFFKKIYEKLEPGHYYQDNAGAWKKK